MLFFFTSRVISSVVAFLYPGYASYKTLSQRPASEEELERWLMYWCVLGIVVGIEYVGEWVISWIPFYYTLKTIFLLYIALPQTRGSSYLYKAHLQPFFQTHETQIDSTLARLKTRLYAFLQQRAKMLWDQAAGAVGQTPQANTMDDEMADAVQPPMGGPMQLVSSLWGSYGPGIIASGMALAGAARVQAQSGAGNKRPGASVLTTPPSSRIRSTRSSSITAAEERKRQLEAELQELNNAMNEEDEVPVTVIEGLPGGSGTTSRSSSNSMLRLKGHVRRRSESGETGGRFEEVEVPSDVEGYDIAGEATADGRSAGAGSGWFSGWGSGAGKDTERVKND